MSARRGLKVALVGVNAPGYASLGLAYIRAYAIHDLRLAGTGFTTLDLDTGVDPWWIAYRVLGLQADVVAFSVMCWNARAVFEASRIIHQAAPGTLIVLGGPEVGPIAEQTLGEQPAVAAVVRGEGEVTFAELLEAIAHGRRIDRVEGVSSRLDGRIVSAPDRALVEDLDRLPSPYLSGVLQPRDGMTFLETYRGCPHRCGYCFEGKGYGRVRRFSDDRIAAEIAHIAGEHGVRWFSFIDPVFNLTHERLELLGEILAPYAQRGVRLHTIEVDVERIDDAEAALLASMGVASVETGPQTIGARALATCSRRFDREKYLAGVAALKKAGITVEADLIIGLPGDGTDDVVAGMDFVVDADPGTVQMSTLHVLPGTDLWQRASELGLAYDPMAPHEVVATGDIGFADLRRLEVLGSALSATYRAKLPKRGSPS